MLLTKKEKRKEFDRKYYQKKKDKIKLYNQRLDVKARKKLYNQRSDVKEKRRLYNQRSDVKTRKKLIRNLPLNKLKKKIYMKKYNKRPKVMAI